MKNKKPSKRAIQEAKMMDKRVFNGENMNYLTMLVEARSFRLFPNQYGPKLATKLREEFNMMSIASRHGMGDAAICFDMSGKLEIKHSYMGVDSSTFAIKNIRLWQNFDFFVLSLIDIDKDYNPEMYVIRKNDFTQLQTYFNKQNSDGTGNKSKRRVGQSLVFKRGSEVHQKLRELNILPTTTFASFSKFIKDFKDQNPNCKSIPNFSKYTILSDGTVWSNDRKRPAKCTTRNGGFQYVGMTNDQGKAEVLYLPKVIAMAFTPNPNGYKYVKHHNGDNMDNRLENLYWSETKSRTFKTKKGKVKSTGLTRRKYSVKTSTGESMVMTVPVVSVA